MIDARIEDQWNHTALLASILINANREKGKKPVTLYDIHPCHMAKKEQQKSIGIAARMNRDLKENLRSIKRK